MQVYREEAHYLERTAPWIERVGLAYVKQRVVDDVAGRAELYARFWNRNYTARMIRGKSVPKVRCSEYASLATVE